MLHLLRSKQKFFEIGANLNFTKVMRRILTLLIALSTLSAWSQSTSGMEVVFDDNFRNNKNGWEVSMDGDNRSKVSSDYQYLIIGINNRNENEKATAYTTLNFNKDFVLKAEIKCEPRDKDYDDGTEIGLFVGHSNYKYRHEQGVYGYKLILSSKEDPTGWMYASNDNGTQLFIREMDNLPRFDPGDYNEIGLEKKDGDIIFYLNGQELYRNDATVAAGGAITFYAYNRQKAFMRNIQVYQPAAPTPEEKAAEEAKAQVISEEEEEVIVEAVSNLQFDTNKSTIKASSLPNLNKMAEMMVKNTKFKVILKGHTDNQGNDELNMKLSQDRVNTVKEYLVSKGIDAGRITALGYGDKRPIATNETPEGRQKNRRVEFEIVQ
jgi:outer membrane protein OmpA-like peptidoglycan-associated protein